MTSIDASIGASVIDYFQRNNRNNTCVQGAAHNNEAQAAVTAAAASNECLPLVAVDEPCLHQQQQPPLPSLIPFDESNNFLLRGPPQSGRTSLAMNLAHAIACSFSPTAATTTTSTRTSNGPCHGDDNCDIDSEAPSCQCTAVAILSPLKTNSSPDFKQQQGGESSFPLFCHAAATESPSSPSQDFLGQLRALQQEEHQQQPAHKASVSSWNKAALRRIQVHRMASVRDVMDYLLSIQAAAPNQRPLGGIIIEDLDYFATKQGGGGGRTMTSNANESSSGSGGSELSTEALMAMTQLLALFADTANTLRSLSANASSSSSSSSFIVLATMGEHVPWNVNRLWSNWFPTCLKILTCSSSVAETTGGWKVPLLDEDESVDSCHVLENVQGFAGAGTAGKEQHSAMSIAEYAVIRKNSGLFRIVWKRSNE